VKRALRLAVPAYLLSEAFLTLRVASWLGAGTTFLLLILGAAAGIAVLRAEQFSLLSRLRRIIATDAPLVPGLLDGALRGVAGVLLIVPGFISDFVALGLLIPQLRRRLIHYLSARLGAEPTIPVVIEGDYRRVDDMGLAAPKRDCEDPDPARTDQTHPNASRTQGAEARRSKH
jgi:UPF0716 protein FxsA